MTADDFRALALALPEVTEAEHMHHPDFRVRGKIFATLGPNEDRGMVKLTPAQQADVMHAEPGVFGPASGAWGARGATIVQLRRARKASVRHALDLAWRNTAPRRLVEEHDAG